MQRLYEYVYVIVHRCTRACRLFVLKSGVCACVRACACVRVCVNNFGSVCVCVCVCVTLQER